MEYLYYLFDLDGTLTDPGVGITNSVMYALEKYGITDLSREELYKFIGPPLRESFMKYYGFSDEEAEHAVGFYREYFREKGLYENRVYTGIPSMLAELKRRGKILALATSKPEEFSVRILRHFHLDMFFDFIGAATMDASRNRKEDVIRYCLESLSVQDRRQVLMVGDRRQDICGAAANQIDSAGVLYGYGDYEELHSAGAVYLAESPEKLLEL